MLWEEMRSRISVQVQGDKWRWRQEPTRVLFFSPSSRFPKKTRSGSVGESRSRSRICSQATRKGHHHSIADAGIPGIKNRTREKNRKLFSLGEGGSQGVDFLIRLTIETFPSLSLDSISWKQKILRDLYLHSNYYGCW